MKLIAILFITACIPMMQRDRSAEYQRMCADPNATYEAGYNTGAKRGRLDTSWVGMCAPQMQQQTRQAYQTGYNTGVANAPAVIHTGIVVGSERTCRFSSDCGEDQSCRAGASGTEVCMGGGYTGDACWFSSDCVSGSCDGAAKTCR
jgi:hypothetical protein